MQAENASPDMEVTWTARTRTESAVLLKYPKGWRIERLGVEPRPHMMGERSILLYPTINQKRVPGETIWVPLSRVQAA